jgi:ActR/RegA family two-component response regulator
MRRTQPACINFILTGYREFEAAPEIRNQLDEYLVKPANVQEPVASLQTNLLNPRNIRCIQPQSLANLLRDHATELCGLAMPDNSDIRFAAVPFHARTGRIICPS